jgi:hypothetical protein
MGQVHPARAGGGLWLWKTLVPSGLRAVVVPSGLRVTVQPHWWMATWWRKKQYNAQLLTLVVPPSARWVTWCTSQAAAGWSQPPAQRQCWSRRMTARRMAAGISADRGGMVQGEPVARERLAAMMLQLQERGCCNINFVTPEHVVPQILQALPAAIDGGLRLPIVYNTSCYDSGDSLALMDGIR